MTLLVDTSVWSLAFRRDDVATSEHVQALQRALSGEELIVTTGIIMQELLQGFAGPRNRAQIVELFSTLPFIWPDRQDHIDAADLHNTCRRKGMQLAPIDALLAQLCVHHGLTMLTTDKDFSNAAAHCSLEVWRPTNKVIKMQQSEKEIDKLLRRAISERRMVTFVLDGKSRVAEPHDYGVIDDERRLFFYQMGGDSSSGRPLGWRWAALSKISRLTLRDQYFSGSRPAPSGKHIKWDKLFATVSSRETD